VQKKSQTPEHGLSQDEIGMEELKPMSFQEEDEEEMPPDDLDFAPVVAEKAPDASKILQPDDPQVRPLTFFWLATQRATVKNPLG